MATSANPEPTVVLYKSNLCRHCTAITNIWDTPTKDDDSITGALRKVHPKLRFNVITAKDNTGKFDENIAPKELIKYGTWFPMILLIPGRLWDTAMSKLGPKNDVILREGVQIMNGIWDGNDLKYAQKYDIRKPSEFARWLREAMDNDDFKRVQNGPSHPPTTQTGINIPTIPTQSNPIQPLLTSISRPQNTTNNYVATNSFDRNSSIESGSKPKAGDNFAVHGDVCSMRIISRPQ